MKFFRITCVLLLLAFFHTPSLATDKCNNIQLQLKGVALKHLVIERLIAKSEKTKLTLGYVGFFLKENARQEGRRVISHLMKCNKVKYDATKTLFGYTLSVETTPLSK
ncbi:MAG: hypothetical protein ACI936_003416 [Paraglaciecola sp.]|jgi:hypothetical protein